MITADMVASIIGTASSGSESCTSPDAAVRWIIGNFARESLGKSQITRSPRVSDEAKRLLLKLGDDFAGVFAWTLCTAQLLSGIFHLREVSTQLMVTLWVVVQFLTAFAFAISVVMLVGIRLCGPAVSRPVWMQEMFGRSYTLFVVAFLAYIAPKFGPPFHPKQPEKLPQIVGRLESIRLSGRSHRHSLTLRVGNGSQRYRILEEGKLADVPMGTWMEVRILRSNSVAAATTAKGVVVSFEETRGFANSMHGIMELVAAIVGIWWWADWHALKGWLRPTNAT